MTSAVLNHMVHAIWAARITHFWPIWITITITAAIAVAWLVGQSAAPTIRTPAEAWGHLVLTPRLVLSRSSIAVITLLAAFLVCYVGAILTWEDFTYYDNDQFTLYTLRGRDFGPPIWPGAGRFFPLGLQEFNLVRHFTATVGGYHALPILQLLILSCILLVLDDKLNFKGRAALAAFALTAPSVVISFGALICPERNVVFWFACLILFLQRFERTHYTAFAVAAAICAQIMIYYKETAALLLLGLAIGRLILRCVVPDKRALDYGRLRDSENRLDLCLAFLGVVFLLYYVAAMLPHMNMHYAVEGRLPGAQAFLAYVKLDLLVWLLLAVVLGRAWLILRHNTVPSPLWDGLALGGLVYLGAYLYLGMFSAYYLAPVDLIAVLYVGRLVVLSTPRVPLWSRAALAVVVLAVALQDISFSAFSLFERKNLIHAKAQIERIVETRYRSGAGHVKRLYFPFASPYTIMEFASYLDYRGVPVQGGAVRSGGLRNVVMVSRTAEKDGPCVAYRPLACHGSSSPDPGDLVIVLPDDNALNNEVDAYRDRGELLFSYAPQPQVPRWLSPFVQSLHIASLRFAKQELPGGFLHGSVTVWN